MQVGVGRLAGPVLLGLIASHGFEIHAGAERAAGAGEDGATNVVVGVDLLPGVGHADEHGQAQGVLCLGSIHGHDGGGAIALKRQMLS